MVATQPRGWWQTIRPFVKAPWSLLLSRMLVGSLLLWAGMGKTADTQTFLAEARWDGLVPPAALPALAVVLPLLEVLLGLALLLGLFQRWTARTVAVFLGIVTVALIATLIRDQVDRCACLSVMLRPTLFPSSVSLVNATLDLAWLLLSAFVGWAPLPQAIPGWHQRTQA